jgi:hypothetical protein
MLFLNTEVTNLYGVPVFSVVTMSLKRVKLNESEAQFGSLEFKFIKM